ncbi:uncharacterized protein C663.15c [Trichoderma asperellum]|uniref:Uncharacterized protein C663.15c n=1 Tax=Trichoderma asperellum TaxID=101201 RepID=A0A6V8R3Z5_TRIAP|nr:uncharacterized protein C663.15c [Trichoderma asperellum]
MDSKDAVSEAPPSSATEALTEAQTRALFDILTHHETYGEIEGFKAPDAVTSYGHPFARTMKVPAMQTPSVGGTPKSGPGTPTRSRTPVSAFWLGGRRGNVVEEEEEKKKARRGDGDDDSDDDSDVVEESTSPVLQMLLTRLVLPFPGVRDLPREFWDVRMQGLLARFAEADLSESFDKGAMGTRKTLATGASSVMEMVARGLLGGVDRGGGGGGGGGSEEKKETRLKGEYDEDKAEELAMAFEDAWREWAYGELVEEMFDHVKVTEDVESHSPMMKAALDYAIIHLATFAHHIFILSPEGQYLLKLIENINSLIPYKMIKQTLRIGNAATMISGMMRLMLAKLSVTSLTNWVGLTANADDGMNLLQRIISLVLSWDASEFKKSADKVEKGKGDAAAAPTDEMLEAIRLYVSLPRSEHVAAREESVKKSRSIVVTVLEAADPQLAKALTEAQHAQCLEYYSALLSVHDRDAITSVLCRQPPDLFTQALKDIVGAYEPIIRSVHSRVDLRFYLEAVQGFIADFIRASRPKKGGRREDEGGEVASVEDYVVLLRNNRGLLYRWIHDFAKNCPEVWEDFRTWAKDVAVRFRQPREDDDDDDDDGGGNRRNMKEQLGELFASLDGATKDKVLQAIDSHARYLDSVTQLSRRRLQAVINATAASSSAAAAASSKHQMTSGPGVYLSQWQSLLDTTVITPSSKEGGPRHGEDVKFVTTMGKLGLGGKKLAGGRGDGEEELKAPDVSVVVEALGEAFRGVVRERAKEDVLNEMNE